VSQERRFRKTDFFGHPLASHPVDCDRQAEHFLRHYPSWRGDDRLSIRIMMTGVSRTRTQVSGNKADVSRGNNDPVSPAQWLRLNGEELKIIAGWVLCTFGEFVLLCEPPSHFWHDRALCRVLGQTREEIVWMNDSLTLTEIKCTLEKEYFFNH